MLAPFVEELDRLAPSFKIHGSRIRIIQTPTEFYETLKVRRNWAIGTGRWRGCGKLGLTPGGYIHPTRTKLDMPSEGYFSPHSTLASQRRTS